MKKYWTIGLALVLLLALIVSAASAQENGSIRGAVYQDVNGDGKCVDTGVAGEGPVKDVNLEFVNTGGDWTVNLYSGENGTFGLVAAGFGYWRVTAQPNSEWYVTSQNPVYVAIDEDKPLAVDVVFCVSRGLYYPIVPVYPVYPVQPLPAVLPESGAAASTTGGWGTAIFAFVGLSFLAVGAGLEWQRRRRA
ncbi:MAG: hypothetical protein KC441_12610 [Anaerolineales bacterium]|nr:hypothetical protein [Anaerolineales bacterium]